MSEFRLKMGREYYTRDGYKVQLIAHTDDSRFVVQALITVDTYDDGGVDAPGHMFVADALYETPPLSVVNEEIARLRAEKGELERENRHLRASASNAEREVQERLSRLKRFDVLEHLEAFLNGEITHFVVHTPYSVAVVSIEDCEARCGGHSGGDRPLRLISLTSAKPRFSRSADLRWRVNQYSDGSGSDKDCIPCTSEEQANEQARKLVAERMKTDAHRWADFAIKFGVPVPSNVVEARAKREAERLRDSVQRAAQDADRANKKLADMKAELERVTAD